MKIRQSVKPTMAAYNRILVRLEEKHGINSRSESIRLRAAMFRELNARKKLA